VENLAPWAKLFFGHPSGIDLPGEVAASTGSRLALESLSNSPAARVWTTGLDYQLAIGQGSFSCTVIQAAVMIGAVANGAA